MKTKMKSILALLLAVLMLLTCAPTIAFAADLPTPKNLMVSGGDGIFEVKWDSFGDVEQMPVRYSYVMYSTDQTNWLKAAYVAKGSSAISIRQPEEGAFVPGTTYYFSAQCFDWNEKAGPRSNIVSAKYTDSKAQLKADWDKLVAGYKMKTTEKGSKYDKQTLVKGETVVFDNGLYTLTVQVSAVSKTKATLNVTMKSKTGAEYECFYLGWDGKGNEHGMSMDVHNNTKTVNVNLKNLSDGANFLKFSVTAYGNPISKYRDVAPTAEYDEYSDSLLRLNRSHVIYFQNAPQASKLTFAGNNLKVTSSAISFGSAYKSGAKAVKSSGTILYYKTTSAKSWSKKSFAAGKTLKLTKLKANTEYQLRTINFVKSVSAADGKTVITSKSSYSNTLKIRTGLADAPEIKSLKVTSKVVKVHHDAEWWYNGSKWIYKEAYDSTQTNFTVKVTLKTVPKSMKALQCSGLGSINTQVRTSKGKTFTFTGARAGNAKGKSVSLSFFSYTNDMGGSVYAGQSPSVKKSVTL